MPCMYFYRRNYQKLKITCISLHYLLEKFDFAYLECRFGAAAFEIISMLKKQKLDVWLARPCHDSETQGSYFIGQRSARSRILPLNGTVRRVEMSKIRMLKIVSIRDLHNSRKETSYHSSDFIPIFHEKRHPKQAFESEKQIVQLTNFGFLSQSEQQKC